MFALLLVHLVLDVYVGVDLVLNSLPPTLSLRLDYLVEDKDNFELLKVLHPY